MTKRLLLASVMLLGGCAFHVLTNDEAIAEYKKCEAAGMKAKRIAWGDGETMAIECVPPDTK